MRSLHYRKACGRTWSCRLYLEDIQKQLAWFLCWQKAAHNKMWKWHRHQVLLNRCWRWGAENTTGKSQEVLRMWLLTQALCSSIASWHQGVSGLLLLPIPTCTICALIWVRVWGAVGSRLLLFSLVCFLYILRFSRAVFKRSTSTNVLYSARARILQENVFWISPFFLSRVVKSSACNRIPL